MPKHAILKIIAGAVIALATYFETAQIIPPGLSALLSGVFGYGLGWVSPPPGKPQDGSKPVAP
jgi:hypothetical protein